LPCCRKRKW